MITQPRYRLADRLIDPSQCTILKDGILLKVELRAMQVLLCLIKHADEPVSREMLLEEVWSGGEVSDNAINRIIGLLRNQLGDNAKSPSFIKTLPKVGYVLISEVTLVKAISRKEKFTEEVVAGSLIGVREGADANSLKKNVFSFLYTHSGKFVLLLSGLIVVSTWLAFKYLSLPQQTRSIFHDVKLKRLTYFDGQEFNPDLSDDGKLLAFSQREYGEKYWRLGLMRIDNGEVNYLNDPFDSQGYSSFSPDGSQLAYLSFNKSGECQINRVDIIDGMFGNREKIIDCKNQMQSTSIEWKINGNGIFYIDESHQLDYLSQKMVFSVSLSGLNKKQLSLPYPIGRGDYSISLSPNGNDLAVIRNVRWYQSQIMLLSLNTGSWIDLFKVDSLLHSVGWSGDSGSIIYKTNDGNLASYNIDKSSHEQFTNIMQPIMSPVSNSSGDVVAVLGTFVKTEILRFKTPFDADESTNGVFAVTKDKSVFISSNSSNIRGVISPDGKKMVFESDRTGMAKLWFKSESGSEVQLDAFEDIQFIRDISFSFDSEFLLGRQGNKPFTYNIQTQVLEYIDVDENVEVYNVSWGVDKAHFVASVDMLGKSSIDLIDVLTGKSIRTLADGGEFGRYSSTGRFYFTRHSQGLWVLEGGEEKLLIDDFTVRTNMSWMIVKNYLYNLVYVEGVNYIERINLVDYSKQTVKLDNNNIIGNSISVDEHGNVFLVASEQSNVDIVKIVFSKADL